MNRSKSAAAGPVIKAATTDKDDIRGLCKRISPYIVREWRVVCEELGVSDADMDRLQDDHVGLKMSSLAFQGLCCWLEAVGRTANKDRLLRIIQLCGLRRAEDEIRAASLLKRVVPFLGQPETAAPITDVPINKHNKQRAVAERLSRPKSTKQEKCPPPSPRKRVTSAVKDRLSLTPLPAGPSKPNEICEVKIKITVKGVQQFNQDEVVSTRDNFQSTKDDFKQTCHTFVKLVASNQKSHFTQLKQLLGFPGISVQRLTKVGFNINLFILCFNLGAFETLNQSYSTGRLKNIVHGCLVTVGYLEKLKVRKLELSVLVEEGLINKYRDILLVRGVAEPIEHHPIEIIPSPDPDSEEETKSDEDDDRSFDLHAWQKEMFEAITSVTKRYEEFNKLENDLLVTLRIIKPPDTDKIASLQDVLNYFKYLRNSKSVSSGVRTDLVQEYLTIVNQIRIKTSGVRENVIDIVFDKSLQEDVCEDVLSLLNDLEEMLEPSAEFVADENQVTHALSGMECELFGGLLCYIPKLVFKMRAIVESTTRTVEVNAKDNNSETNNSVHENDVTDDKNNNKSCVKETNNKNESKTDNEDGNVRDTILNKEKTELSILGECKLEDKSRVTTQYLPTWAPL